MKILFTGKGGSAGSWKIRGEQMGRALGATVKPLATVHDLRACDVVVVVKRTPAQLVAALRASGKPWVFDVVDCYPQPASSAWSRQQAIQWVRDHIAALNPSGVIWPNQRMADDCTMDLPGIVLYHHHRPGIAQNPIRERVEVVGYEGEPNYLEEWLPVLQSECARRGWRFEANPNQLADLDIVVALRGGRWDGYASRHWKSNVKLANAHGSGTAFVGQPESGYLETAAGGERWANNPAHIAAAFDSLAPLSARLAVRRTFLAAAHPIEDAAARLRDFLNAL